MTEEKVIQSGKEILEMNMGFVGYLGVILIFIGMVSMIVLFVLKSEYAMLPFLLVLIGTCFHIFYMGELTENKNLAWSDWKKEIANPYVASLPITKENIDSIEFNKNISTKEAESNFYTKEVDTKTSPKSPVIVSFQENGSSSLTTLTDYYKVKKDLKNGEKPYVTYQHLDKKLGEGMDKGFYNLEIHLPKDYSFGKK